MATINAMTAPSFGTLICVMENMIALMEMMKKIVISSAKWTMAISLEQNFVVRNASSQPVLAVH